MSSKDLIYIYKHFDFGLYTFRLSFFNTYFSNHKGGAFKVLIGLWLQKQSCEILTLGSQLVDDFSDLPLLDNKKRSLFFLYT